MIRTQEVMKFVTSRNEFGNLKNVIYRRNFREKTYVLETNTYRRLINTIKNFLYLIDFLASLARYYIMKNCEGRLALLNLRGNVVPVVIVFLYNENGGRSSAGRGSTSGAECVCGSVHVTATTTTAATPCNTSTSSTATSAHTTSATFQIDVTATKEKHSFNNNYHHHQHFRFGKCLACMSPLWVSKPHKLCVQYNSTGDKIMDYGERLTDGCIVIRYG